MVHWILGAALFFGSWWMFSQGLSEPFAYFAAVGLVVTGLSESIRWRVVALQEKAEKTDRALADLQTTLERTGDAIGQTREALAVLEQHTAALGHDTAANASAGQETLSEILNVHAFLHSIDERLGALSEVLHRAR